MIHLGKGGGKRRVVVQCKTGDIEGEGSKGRKWGGGGGGEEG